MCDRFRMDIWGNYLLWVQFLCIAVAMISCSAPVGSLNYTGKVLESGTVSPYFGLNVITVPVSNKLKRFDLPSSSIQENIDFNQTIRRPATFLSPAMGLRIGLPFQFELGLRYNWLRSANVFLRYGIIQREKINISFGAHVNYYNWNMHPRPNPNGIIFPASIAEFMVPLNNTFELDKSLSVYFAPAIGKVFYSNYMIVKGDYPQNIYAPITISYPQLSLAMGLQNKLSDRSSVNIELYSNIYPFISAELAVTFQISKKCSKN